MKVIQSKYKLTLMLLLLSYLSFAQFNTLKPTVPIKSENPKVSDKTNVEEPVNQKKNKRSWKDGLKITTKSDLKNEIDSLKMMIKKYSTVKEVRKNEFEILKDSLLLQTKNRVEETRKTSEKQKPIATYDFVDEPKDFFSKIVMPLQNKLTVTSSYGTRRHPIFGTK